jgi:hypothetical protein
MHLLISLLPLQSADLLFLVVLASSTSTYVKALTLRGASRHSNDGEASTGPLKVFLLAGQSTRVGRGSVEHLKLLNDGKSDGPDCPCEYQTFWNGTQYNDRRGKPTPGTGFGTRNYLFRPELGFGWILGDEMNETVVGGWRNE